MTRQIPEDAAARSWEFVGRGWAMAAVADWAENGSERFLLMTAKPGFGKTALAAWLAGAGPAPGGPDAARLDRLRCRWDATHFCVARGQGSTVLAEEFALSLARQLAARHPDYDQAILRQQDVTINASITRHRRTIHYTLYPL